MNVPQATIPLWREFVTTRGREVGTFLRLSRAAVGLWQRLANSRPLAWLTFLAIYTLPTILLARQKLLWDDEFFTLYLSTTKNWTELIKALSTGGDQHPPSFYYLTHLIFSTFGISNVTLRLTAIIGFAALCICLYEIAGRMLNREWGFCAMLLPLALPYSAYSVEARGYGLELGFVAFAYLMWFLASAGDRRRLTLPLLAAALGAAVACHYYAVLAVLPLAAGELVRTLVRRRIDWLVWAAFGGVLVPVIVFARVVASAQTYSGHFWAIPRWISLVGWYKEALWPLPAILLPLCVLSMLTGSIRPASNGSPHPAMKSWHAAAFVSLSLLPMAAVVIAKLVTHAFADRYAIAAIPGICVLLAVGFSRASGYSTRTAAALWVLTVMTAGGLAWRSQQQFRLEVRDLRYCAAVLRRYGDQPIVMGEMKTFHRLSFYAKRDLAQRLVFLSDPHASLRHLGFDTTDRGLLALNPWFPLNVRWFDDWVSTHPSFLVWTYVGPWSWIPVELAKRGVETRVERVWRLSLLLSVKGIQPMPDYRQPGDPPGEPMLFSQTPQTGKPLCERYTSSTNSCPALD